MPIGIQRLNAKKSQPNTQIIFIKPLKGPDEKIAQDFLERIAAQCLPIMRDHSLSVMALEEYEPNSEFVGRNFNAGEVVQLVLKARSGRWLPFEYVQMVMMHELAHCKQMNHSRSFWAVRNQYAEQMRGLWSRGYTGDGIWGRGALLKTGEWETNSVLDGEILPEHLCGGTYRSRRRKRKAKPKLSYQEQKERRILKKFGANGIALGADEETKVKLEKGKRTQAKPRVAGSARGRELRAAAALARFEQKKEEPEVKAEDEDETASEESEYEEDAADIKTEDAVDLDGSRLVDGNGRGMVKVCEDENPDDQDAQQEVRELQSSVKQWRQTHLTWRQDGESASKALGARTQQKDHDNEPRVRYHKTDSTLKIKTEEDESTTNTALRSSAPTIKREHSEDANRTLAPEPTPTASGNDDDSTRACELCSFANPAFSITCSVCSHVLDPDSVPNSWRCQSSSCKGSLYLNPGDYAVCRICGQSR